MQEDCKAKYLFIFLKHTFVFVLGSFVEIRIILMHRIQFNDNIFNGYLCVNSVTIYVNGIPINNFSKRNEISLFSIPSWYHTCENITVVHRILFIRASINESMDCIYKECSLSWYTFCTYTLNDEEYSNSC